MEELRAREAVLIQHQERFVVVRLPQDVVPVSEPWVVRQVAATGEGGAEGTRKQGPRPLAGQVMSAGSRRLRIHLPLSEPAPPQQEALCKKDFDRLQQQRLNQERMLLAIANAVNDKKVLRGSAAATRARFLTCAISACGGIWQQQRAAEEADC
jgi:hypothetical protein